MRLIDADWIVDSDIANCLGAEYCSCVPDVRDMLNDQPTAYDVDNILMCLDGRAEDCREKGRRLEEAGMETASREMYAKAYSYEEAIEIVKGGGVEKR